jgi:hypothetical protein
MEAPCRFRLVALEGKLKADSLSWPDNFTVALRANRLLRRFATGLRTGGAAVGDVLEEDDLEDVRMVVPPG